VAIVSLALVGACATRAERAGRWAQDRGYERLVLTGASFQHVAYFKRGDSNTSLHVYIEHDGIPWVTRTQPATDPTPRRLLMLELMARDSAPALYLGRPCYFGTAARPPCAAIWWTHRRFSMEVIESMDAALATFLGAHTEFESIEFFGYSGGGVIATLMAAHFPAARRLVTIAAPLDLEGWRRLHQYDPLEGSISPLGRPPLPASVTQLHVGGVNDDVVPAGLIQSFVARQERARFLEIPGVDHDCCWDTMWESIVRDR
jgi:dienelactone hydrolase